MTGTVASCRKQLSCLSGNRRRVGSAALAHLTTLFELLERNCVGPDGIFSAPLPHLVSEPLSMKFVASVSKYQFILVLIK